MRAAPVALVVIATLAPWGAADARPKKKKAAELVDISAAKSQLKVLTDSDGSIYVMDSGYRDDTMVFYGDKKVVYRQRIIGGGANGPAFSFRFWAPRVDTAPTSAARTTATGTCQCGRSGGDPEAGGRRRRPGGARQGGVPQPRCGSTRATSWPATTVATTTTSIGCATRRAARATGSSSVRPGR
jgi:hypothetical protein